MDPGKINQDDVEKIYNKLTQKLMNRGQADIKKQWEDPKFVEKIIQMVSIAAYMQEYISQNEKRIPKNENDKIMWLLKERHHFSTLYSEGTSFFYLACNGILFEGQTGEFVKRVLDLKDKPDEVATFIQSQNNKIWDAIKSGSMK